MVPFYSDLAAIPLINPHPHPPNMYAEFSSGNIAKMSIRLAVGNQEQRQQVIGSADSTLSPLIADIQTHYGEVAIASHDPEYYLHDLNGNRLLLHETISR